MELVKGNEDIYRRVCKFRKNSVFVLEFRVVGGNANFEAGKFPDESPQLVKTRNFSRNIVNMYLSFFEISRDYE